MKKRQGQITSVIIDRDDFTSYAAKLLWPSLCEIAGKPEYVDTLELFVVRKGGKL